MITGKPIFTSDEILARVDRLAERISTDYEGKNPVMVGLLKGAFMFFSDLVKRITTPLSIDFMIASSYVMTNSSGKVSMHADLREDIRGRHVILVDDIIDTGVTINYIRETLLGRSPESLSICVLLDKKDRRIVDVPVDYTGFTVPNEFLVGYGLDYDNQYRNLPYIAAFRKSS